MTGGDQLDLLRWTPEERAKAASLDSWAPGQRPPRARRRDAASSHRAADEAERSGRVGAQALLVLKLVERFPGRSSSALAAAAPPPPGLSAEAWRYVVARRLPDPLGRRGLVVRTQRGEDDLLWWPAAYERPPDAGEIVSFPPTPRRSRSTA